jgi:hypothetical protein
VKNFVVGGVTPEEAEELAKPGEVDRAFFGMSWLTHLDLAKFSEHPFWESDPRHDEMSENNI